MTKPGAMKLRLFWSATWSRQRSSIKGKVHRRNGAPSSISNSNYWSKSSQFRRPCQTLASICPDSDLWRGALEGSKTGPLVPIDLSSLRQIWQLFDWRFRLHRKTFFSDRDFGPSHVDPRRAGSTSGINNIKSRTCLQRLNFVGRDRASCSSLQGSIPFPNSIDNNAIRIRFSSLTNKMPKGLSDYRDFVILKIISATGLECLVLGMGRVSQWHNQTAKYFSEYRSIFGRRPMESPEILRR
jgi:hypothetical protein